MSATGHERRRREQAAERVMEAVKDVRAFVEDEGLPCEPTRDALAAYLPTHDRVTLDEMTARAASLNAVTRSVQSKAFDLSGPWMKVRAEVRDTLELDRVPKSKAEACEQLEAAGYQVTGV